MDTSDEKTATIEFNNAKEDEFVQGGYLSVAAGEGIEVVSELNDGGKVLIGFIAPGTHFFVIPFVLCYYL